jgi:hypothetical protein
MPVTLTTKTISQQWSSASDAGTNSFIVQKRIVANAALDGLSSADTKTIIDAAAANPMQLFGTFSTTTLLGPMRVRDAKVVTVPNSGGKIFDVAVTYNTEYTWAENVLAAEGNEIQKYILPVSTEWEAGERSVQAYRQYAASPAYTFPAANLNSSADIGGLKIDEGGKPVELRIPSTDFKVSLIVDTTQYQLVVLYDDVSSTRGKWNSTTFLHFNANSVYCIGASVSHIRDEFYRVTYSFKWDEWYDCTQECLRDGEGYVIGDGASHAGTVYWRSQVRTTFDHNVIFNSQPDSTVAKQIAKEGCFVTYP